MVWDSQAILILEITLHLGNVYFAVRFYLKKMYNKWNKIFYVVNMARIPIYFEYGKTSNCF